MKKKDWNPNSWSAKTFIKKQQPQWSDANKLKKVVQKIKKLPPLVFSGEIRSLKEQLALAGRGKAFLLQGGSCAESFEDCTAINVREDLKVLLQMALILSYTGSKKVIKVGRIAGQFAKPRSKDTETIDGIELPSYRGDMVNRLQPEEQARIPNPENLLQAYFYSAATLNILRAFTKGGFASLEWIDKWNQKFVKTTKKGKLYKGIATEIEKAIQFFSTIGISAPEMHEVEYFTSHEALILEYEEALTRQDSLSTSKDWYNCSAHFLWIGDRTRNLDSAHLEILRGVVNPIGIKIGPNHDAKEIIQLIEKLNPSQEEGKIVLITRFGYKKIKTYLTLLIQKIQKAGHPVVWSCDPMHGNTYSTKKHKTRNFKEIMKEVENFFQIHHTEGTHPGGIHIELTGQNVTECVGGINRIREKDLSQNYLTQCDPRLNAEQGIEMAFRIASFFKK